jgi:hypothetical protein
MFYPRALPTGILVPATQSFSKCILGPTVIRCFNRLPRTISAYANQSAFSSRLVDMHQCTPNIGDTRYLLCLEGEKRFITRVERHDAFGLVRRLRLYHCEASASTQLGPSIYTGCRKWLRCISSRLGRGRALPDLVEKRPSVVQCMLKNMFT